MLIEFSSSKSRLAHKRDSLPLVEVDLGDLEDEVGESSSDTSDDSEGEHDLSFTIDVSVLDSQNVGELVCLSQHNGGLYTPGS